MINVTFCAHILKGSYLHENQYERYIIPSLAKQNTKAKPTEPILKVSEKCKIVSFIEKIK